MTNANSDCAIEYGNSTGGAETTGYTGADTGGWALVAVAFKLVVAGTDSSPAYAGAASDLGGGSGSWGTRRTPTVPPTRPTRCGPPDMQKFYFHDAATGNPDTLPTGETRPSTASVTAPGRTPSGR